MQALNGDELQFWEGIIELITPIDFIKMIREYEKSKFLPEEYIERLKTLFESVVDREDYKYERRKELFNKFITRIKINHRLCIEWEELYRDIIVEFDKMSRSQERALSEKKRQRQRRREAKKKKAINQRNISGKEFLQAQK